MKNLLLLFLVLFSCSFYGQSYTEKYNSVYERYEYYNSNNELVGYKKYDPVYEEWKYTDLTQQRQERNSPYANLKVMDPFNEQLAYKVLASKQARYDSNVNKIQNKIEELFNNLNSHPSLQEKFSNVITRFNNENKNFDYSSGQQTASVINYFINIYNEIISDLDSVPSNFLQITKKQSRHDYGGLYKQMNDAKPFYKWFGDQPVYILEDVNQIYCKVSVDGKTGYTLKPLLEFYK